MQNRVQGMVLAPMPCNIRPGKRLHLITTRTLLHELASDCNAANCSRQDCSSSASRMGEYGICRTYGSVGFSAEGLWQDSAAIACGLVHELTPTAARVRATEAKILRNWGMVIIFSSFCGFCYVCVASVYLLPPILGASS